MKLGNKIFIKNIFLYVLLFCLVSVCLIIKRDYHVDELLTYNLSNADEWFEPNLGEVYLPADSPFIDAMASDGEINFKNVWKQQAEDTHPPFYYILVHIICKFSPGSISVKYAGVVNMIFIMLTLWCYRKLLGIFVDDDNIIYILSLAFCLSAGVLSIASFLRMYVMVMFFVTAITYYIIQNLKSFDLKKYVSIAIITICGALTHYYFIIYIFFISFILTIILVIEKRYKEILFYIISMLGAGGAVCLIFPSIIEHIFLRGRGTESIENLKTTSLIEQLEIYFGILNDNIFNGLLCWLFVFILFLLITAQTKKREVKSDSDEVYVFTCRHLLWIVPVLGYIVIVSKSAPYNVDRYISPIYAVVFSGVMAFLYENWKRVCTNIKVGNIIYSCIIIIITITGLVNCKMEYLYLEEKDRLENSLYYGSNADAIVIYDDVWKVNTYYLEIKNCKSSIFYELETYDEFKEVADIGAMKDDIAFFLVGIDSDLFIKTFLIENPEYIIKKDNGEWLYGHSFYLGKEH